MGHPALMGYLARPSRSVWRGFDATYAEGAKFRDVLGVLRRAVVGAVWCGCGELLSCEFGSGALVWGGVRGSDAEREGHVL